MKDLLDKYDSAMLSYIRSEDLFFYLTGIKFKIGVKNTSV